MSDNSTSQLFISHASADDAFVKELRIKLELQGLDVWVDSRNLRGGDQLKPEIEEAIRSASQFIVVISPNTINSDWVFYEIEIAEEVAKQKEDYQAIPLMLPGIKPKALKRYFSEEPAGEPIELDVGKLQEAMPRILAALGERLPDDAELPKPITAKPVAELLLELSRPKLTHQQDGSFQLSSEAELEYIPVDTKLQPPVKSKRFIFTSPIGKIERDDLSWYLETYFKWPTSYDQKRAKAIEAKLPQWGKALYQQVIENNACREVISGWQQARNTSESIFSIRVDAEVLGADPEKQQTEQQQAAQGKC